MFIIETQCKRSQRTFCRCRNSHRLHSLDIARPICRSSPGLSHDAGTAQPFPEGPDATRPVQRPAKIYTTVKTMFEVLAGAAGVHSQVPRGGGDFLGGENTPPPPAPQAAHLRRPPCAHSHLLFGNQHGEAASCRATRVLGAGKTFSGEKSVTRRRDAALSTRQTRKAVLGRLVQKDPLGGGLGSWGWSKTPTNRQPVPFKLGKFCPVRA